MPLPSREIHGQARGLPYEYGLVAGRSVESTNDHHVAIAIRMDLI